MTSSSSAISLAPPHPEPAEDQPAAIRRSHPQQEGNAGDEEVADQRQGDDAKADGEESTPEPQAGETVEQHVIDRPERSRLPPAEMAEHVGKHAKGVEQQKRGKHPE